MPIRSLCLLLLLLSANLASASLPGARLQAIRSEAFSVCSNLLVYYNPNQDGSDPKHAERYRQDLQQLQQLLTEEQDPVLSTAAADMGRQIAELERQPASEAQLYPNWINPLLEAQTRLDQQAAKRYAAALPGEAQQLDLHRLSLNVERLLLLYETRTFGSLAVYVVSVDDNTFPQLDQQILQGFNELQRQWPQQVNELAKLKRKYDFIRPRLLQHDLDWVPSSAAYYLGQVTDGLAKLDAE
ncbi:hypothetical protein D3880_08120 [Pseudomonas cavernae]|uniref:Uncharacterized protein n=1 Tax=Pseudomonas cavernae TaxID=2320867 RepID=A0A385YZM0_9PSED|nr:hypothetical protein [Pseudomonas cavernae]AYC32345.1 hypothetical protein D3880_08120 [Pseudomonas cavernae]